MTDLATLTAGRRADVWIAKAIFGVGRVYVWDERATLWDGAGEPFSPVYLLGDVDWTYCPKNPQVIPHYTTSRGLLVVEELRRQWATAGEQRYWRLTDLNEPPGWEVVIWNYDRWAIQECDPSLHLAICRAALRFVDAPPLEELLAQERGKQDG